jgi:hypothetical protein
MNFVLDLFFSAIGDLLSSFLVLPISVLTEVLISLFTPSA